MNGHRVCSKGQETVLHCRRQTFWAPFCLRHVLLRMRERVTTCSQDNDKKGRALGSAFRRLLSEFGCYRVSDGKALH